MVYVNQKQLDQVEYILEQSAKGHHVLFDLDEIRKAFHAISLTRKPGRGRVIADEPEEDIDPSVLEGKVTTEAEKHIENLILQPTILSKKVYLENLTPVEFNDVVRTYFSIVENNIFEGMAFSH